MKVNRNSWHFKIADMGYPDCLDRRQVTLCAYSWELLKGLVIIALMGVVIMLLLIILGDTIGWAVMCLLNRTWFDPNGEPAAIGLGIFGAFAVLGAIACVVAWFERRQRAHVTPSPVIEVYRAIKDKYCPLLTIE